MATAIYLNEENYSSFKNLKKEWNLDTFDEVASMLLKGFEREDDIKKIYLKEREERIAEWKKMIASGKIDTNSKIYQEHIQSIEEMKKDKNFVKEQMEWETIGSDDGVE